MKNIQAEVVATQPTWSKQIHSNVDVEKGRREEKTLPKPNIEINIFQPPLTILEHMAPSLNYKDPLTFPIYFINYF